MEESKDLKGGKVNADVGGRRGGQVGYMLLGLKVGESSLCLFPLDPLQLGRSHLHSHSPVERLQNLLSVHLY